MMLKVNKRKDGEVTACLEAEGVTVIRFGYRDDWDTIFEQFRYVFGGDA